MLSRDRTSSPIPFSRAREWGRYNGWVMPADGSQQGNVASGAAAENEPMLYCPVCSRRLAERKCKLYCEQCGYYMSCADYY
jgi:hypothetical protein